MSFLARFKRVSHISYFIFKDDLIVSGYDDYKIKVWSAATGECLRTLVGHKALVRALSFDPRSGRLVSVSYDKSVKLWDLGTGECFKSNNPNFFPVAWEIPRLIDWSIHVLIYRLAGKLVREFRGTHNSHIFDVKFDVARIVRWVIYRAEFFFYFCCNSLPFTLFFCASASHDQKIVVLDFSAGLDAKLFV